MSRSLIVRAYDRGASQHFVVRWSARALLIGLGTVALKKCSEFRWAQTIKLSNFSYLESGICAAAITFTAERVFTGCIAYHLWDPKSGRKAPTPSILGLTASLVVIGSAAGIGKLLKRKPLVWACGAALPIAMIQRRRAANSIPPPSKRPPRDFPREGHALIAEVERGRRVCRQTRAFGNQTDGLEELLDEAEEILPNAKAAKELDVARQRIRSKSVVITARSRVSRELTAGKKLCSELASIDLEATHTQEMVQFASKHVSSATSVQDLRFLEESLSLSRAIDSPGVWYHRLSGRIDRTGKKIEAYKSAWKEANPGIEEHYGRFSKYLEFGKEKNDIEQQVGSCCLQDLRELGRPHSMPGPKGREKFLSALRNLAESQPMSYAVYTELDARFDALDEKIDKELADLQQMAELKAFVAREAKTYGL